MNIQIYGHCLENKESVVFNFERGSSDLPDTSNGVAESISSVIVNGFFFKGYLSNEFLSVQRRFYRVALPGMGRIWEEKGLPFDLWVV